MSSRRRRNMFFSRASLLSSASDSPSPPRRKTRKITKTPKVPKRPNVTTRSRLLQLPEEAPDSKITENIQNKVGAYFKSNGFISSDDEDVEFIEPKLMVNKRVTNNSGDEGTSSRNEPSCSMATSTISIADSSADSDIMEFVDDYLAGTGGDKEAVPQKDNVFDPEGLEKFRKETEEMMKDAAKFLEEFTSTKKASSPKVISECAICLESLKSRPTSATKCGHVFCTECIIKACTTLKKCPTCRAAISTKKIFAVYL